MVRVKVVDVRVGIMIFGDGLVKVNLDDMDLGIFGFFGFNFFMVNCGCEWVDGIDFWGSNEGDFGVFCLLLLFLFFLVVVEVLFVGIVEEDLDFRFDFLLLYVLMYWCFWSNGKFFLVSFVNRYKIVKRYILRVFLCEKYLL